jgi:hypothetical protein
MRALVVAAILAASTLPIGSQESATAAEQGAAKPAAAQQLSSSELGFSYSLPADWTVEDTRPSVAQAQQQAASNAQSDSEIRAVGCMEAPFKARHGNGASSVVIVALPFDCYGQHYTDADLPAFASSMAEGMKKGWKIGDPVFGIYSLGAHSLWVERASGSLLEQPENRKTLELVCTMLKNGAVCWMGLVASEADLKAFEQGAVSLDGESSPALVPASAFARKP